MTGALRLIRSRPEPFLASPELKIHRLNKVFHMNGYETNVLRDVSFEVPPGGFLCILGPSGCGKTTLLKLIAGFMAPSSGTVEISGRKVRRPGPDRCVVFQEDALFPWLTVAENVAFGVKGRMPARRIRSEVARYLEMVGLGACGNYLPGEISGGMKQRVALARVLILKPQVLLLDEPFGALDAQTREEMQRLLLALWKELSHTILFITHDLGEAITLADRILIMDKNPGRIRLDVPVGLSRPRKRETDAFHWFYRELQGRM